MTARPAISRRRVLAWIAAAAALPLAGGSGAIGCSTLRLASGLTPGARRRALGRESGVMEAFCATVVPVTAEEAADVVRVYRDPEFPLAQHLPLLIRDLDARSGGEGFDRLPADARREIVLDGSEANGPIGRLYRGAILLTQVAFYASIYDDERGCPAIDYPGAGELTELAEQTYADSSSFLGVSYSPDGNPS
jgi:hypothetical protein